MLLLCTTTMESRLMKTLLVAGVVLCFVVDLHAATPTSGKFDNCGSVPFNITWSPEPISPSNQLKVHVEYQFPEILDGGYYDVTIWFHGDTEPFLEFADSFTCNDIAKYINCPIKKGFKVIMTKVFEHIPNIGSYPGDYDIKLKVTNTKRLDMICLKGHIKILKV